MLGRCSISLSQECRRAQAGWDGRGPPAMSRRHNPRQRLWLCVAGLVAACGPGEVAEAPPRTQQMVLDVSRLSGLSQSVIQRVELTVTGPGIATPIVTELGRNASNSWSASVPGIPAGPARSFRAVAYDSSGVVLYEGGAVSDVMAGSTLVLALVLQDPPEPPNVGVPQISSFEASQGRVVPSTPVDVRVLASGAPGESLSYSWSAECAGSNDPGTFADRSAASTRWTAPSTQPLTCVLSARVASSGGSSVTVYLPIDVSS